LDTPSYNGNIL